MPKKVKIYLAGPMTGLHDGGAFYREEFASLQHSFFRSSKILDPLKNEAKIAKKFRISKKALLQGAEALSPKKRKELFQHIIKKDLALVRSADLLVAYVHKFSYGTTTEIVTAFLNKIPVFLVWKQPLLDPPPWLLAMSTKVFYDLLPCAKEIYALYQARI